MPIFGLMTQKETQRAIDAALKAVQEKYPEWLLRSGKAEEWKLGDSTSEDATTKYYKIVSWVNTAFSMTAEVAASTPMHVKQSKNGEEFTDIVNHPLEALLRKPNPRDSRSEFLRDTFIWQKWGNCFWWMNKFSPDSAPTELWILPANRITIVPDERMFIRCYLYDPGTGGKPIEIPPDEIVHFKGDFNPDSVYVGLGQLASLFNALETTTGMAGWNAKLFKTGNGILPGILAFKDYIQDAPWKEIQETIDRDARQRRITALRDTGSGVSYVKIAESQQEMEFVAGLIHNRTEIWAKLAPGLESVLNANATEANAKAGRATLLDYAIYPAHVRVSEKITSNLLPLFGDDLVAEFEDVRYTDRALQLQEFESLLKVAKMDEARAAKNLAPFGDERDGLTYAEMTKQAAPSWSNNITTGQQLAEKLPVADNAASQEDDAEQATSTAKASAKSAEALEEIKEFRKFARNRRHQKRVDEIALFEFKFVPENEQAELIAEYAGTNDVKSEAIEKLADAVNGYAVALIGMVKK